MQFKNQYYFFVAGLPDFNFDSTKLPFTVEEFKAMLEENLKAADYKLLGRYFLAYDNDFLIRLLTKSDQVEHNPGVLSRDELEAVIRQIKEEEMGFNKNIPPYIEKTIKEWIDEETREQIRSLEERVRELEDRISSLYMDYGTEVKNSLIAAWFEMNLNIGNVLSAFFARKYGLDVKQTVVGNNEIAMTIRENAHARDFGIGTDLEYFDTIQRVTEETNIYERERKIDKFRWEWLEENTASDFFDIEYIFAYLCKLQILERWVKLNAEEGERVFRELIAQLKDEIKKPEDG